MPGGGARAGCDLRRQWFVSVNGVAGVGAVADGADGVQAFASSPSAKRAAVDR